MWIVLLRIIACIAFGAVCFAAGWVFRRSMCRTAGTWDLLMRNLPPEFGVAIVSTGSERGDETWGWHGPQEVGRILRCSTSFECLIGRPSDSVVGMTFAQLTAEGSLEEDLHLFQAVLSGASRGYSLDKSYRTPVGSDGSYFEVPVSLTVVAPDGQEGRCPDWVLAVVVSRERDRAKNQRIRILERALRDRPNSISKVRSILEHST